MEQNEERNGSVCEKNPILILNILSVIKLSSFLYSAQ